MVKRVIGLTVCALMLSGTSWAQDEEEEMSEESMEEEPMEEAEEPEAEMEAEESADEEPAGDSGSSGGGAKYGMAGCGLGSILFDADSGGFGQILAATTNGTFGNQTFGITSGTSNCEDTGGGSESAKAFVETNRSAFAKDVARGSGETIAGLTELAGCANQAAVGKSLQNHFNNIFPSASVSDTEVSERAIQTLRSDVALACSNLT